MLLWFWPNIIDLRDYRTANTNLELRPIYIVQLNGWSRDRKLLGCDSKINGLKTFDDYRFT